jgi:hemolysin D
MAPHFIPNTVGLTTRLRHALAPVLDWAEPAPSAVLEYQSGSDDLIELSVPSTTRRLSGIVGSFVLAGFAAMGLIPVDNVVATTGRVVSKEPTIVLQALETSIVRSIYVQAGDFVRAGQTLATHDPTFTTADLGALEFQAATLQAQVSRLQAEVGNRPFDYDGTDPNLALQAAIFAQRRAEYNLRLETFRHKADSLAASVARSRADAARYRERLEYAHTMEGLRKQLQQLGLGSRINTLQAMDARAEMQRNLDSAEQAESSGEQDLAGLITDSQAYIQTWHSEAAEKLAEAVTRLSDAQQSLRKAQLRRQLVELRAPRDATVMAVSKLSTSSVLSAGQQIMTLVPTDAPMEIEANIPGAEHGYVHAGDTVAIKFDTFPYAQYGMAHGVVRTISPDSFTVGDEQRNPTGAALPPASASFTNGVWYRSRITLDRIDLHDTPHSFHLVPGMPVVADVLVGKQTVLKYLIGRAVPLVAEGMREP